LPDTKNFQEAVDDFAPVQEKHTVVFTHRQQYKRLESLLAALPEAIPTPDEIDKLKKRFQNLADIETAQSRLNNLIEQNKNYESQIQVLSKDLKNTEQELLEQTKGACPICQNQLQF
jgi:predicted  nucleic acid-binding Zn-ribbon protein